MDSKDIEKILSEHGVSQPKELSKALDQLFKQFEKEKLTLSPRTKQTLRRLR